MFVDAHYIYNSLSVVPSLFIEWWYVFAVFAAICFGIIITIHRYYAVNGLGIKELVILFTILMKIRLVIMNTASDCKSINGWSIVLEEIQSLTKVVRKQSYSDMIIALKHRISDRYTFDNSYYEKISVKKHYTKTNCGCPHCPEVESIDHALIIIDKLDDIFDSELGSLNELNVRGGYYIRLAALGFIISKTLGDICNPIKKTK